MNFWLAVANKKTYIPGYPEGWRWDNMFKDSYTLYTPGTPYKSFKDARVGDIVFGYQAKEGIIAAARISRELHEEDGDAGITLVPVGKELNHPIPWSKVGKILSLYSVQISRTLLPVGHEAAHELIKIIEHDGNSEVIEELRQLIG